MQDFAAMPEAACTRRPRQGRVCFALPARCELQSHSFPAQWDPLGSWVADGWVGLRWATICDQPFSACWFAICGFTQLVSGRGTSPVYPDCWLSNKRKGNPRELNHGRDAEFEGSPADLIWKAVAVESREMAGTLDPRVVFLATLTRDTTPTRPDNWVVSINPVFQAGNI